MKIETFTKASYIVIVVFILGLTILGSTTLQNSFNFGNVPTFSNASNMYNNFSGAQSNLEEDFLTTENPGQTDESSFDESRFWVYQGKALKSTWDVLQPQDDAKGTITEIGNYLKINGAILVAIVGLLILSLTFAVIAFWRNRRL